MATHSSVLAWRIPGTGEPGGPTSMGSHRVGHDWSDLAAAVGLDKNSVIYDNLSTPPCNSEPPIQTIGIQVIKRFYIVGDYEDLVKSSQIITFPILWFYLNMATLKQTHKLIKYSRPFESTLCFGLNSCLGQFISSTIFNIWMYYPIIRL